MNNSIFHGFKGINSILSYPKFTEKCIENLTKKSIIEASVVEEASCLLIDRIMGRPSGYSVDE